MIDTFKKE
jgi:hypothetical protein